MTRTPLAGASAWRARQLAWVGWELHVVTKHDRMRDAVRIARRKLGERGLLSA